MAAGALAGAAGTLPVITGSEAEGSAAVTAREAAFGASVALGASVTATVGASFATVPAASFTAMAGAFSIVPFGGCFTAGVGASLTATCGVSSTVALGASFPVALGGSFTTGRAFSPAGIARASCGATTEPAAVGAASGLVFAVPLTPLPSPEPGMTLSAAAPGLTPWRTIH